MTLLAVAVAGRGLVDPSEPVFRADDEALLRGSAAFETLPVYGGRPFELERHLARMVAALPTLGLPSLEEGAAASLVETLTGAVERDFVLRLYRTESSLVATAAEIPGGLDALRGRGLHVHVVETGLPAPLVAGAKATSYALALAAVREAERFGRDDALFVADGIVLEAPTSNGGGERRPALDAGGRRRRAPGRRGGRLGARRGIRARGRGGALPGRRARGCGRGVHDVIDPRGDARRLRERLPVGGGRPGPIAQRLQEALRLRSRP